MVPSLQCLRGVVWCGVVLQQSKLLCMRVEQPSSRLKPSPRLLGGLDEGQSQMANRAARFNLRVLRRKGRRGTERPAPVRHLNPDEPSYPASQRRPSVLILASVGGDAILLRVQVLQVPVDGSHERERKRKRGEGRTLSLIREGSTIRTLYLVQSTRKFGCFEDAGRAHKPAMVADA